MHSGDAWIINNIYPVKMNELLTPKEISKLLKLTYGKVLEMIHLGELKAIRIGKSFRITEYDLHDFIESNRYKSPWE